MKPISTVITILGLAAILAPAPATAQQSGNDTPALHVNSAYRSNVFDLHSGLTKDEFAEFTAELGSLLRFRQLGDNRTVGRGNVDISVQFGTAPFEKSKGAWDNTMSRPTANHSLGPSMSFPRIIGRFGVSDRVDVGVWGGVNPRANYGLVGGDAKIVLIQEGPTRPVSVSIRPSLTSLVGPSEVWAANASLDVSVSRAFGPISPYVGGATTASLAVERSKDVTLDPATADGSLAYAGVSYRWRAVVVSAEVEKATMVSYAFRVGTRF